VTATPQGQEMAQVLSTLNRLEQSRLEAFRRATLPSNALADYLAHCLLLHQEQLRNCGRLQQKGGLLLSDSDTIMKLPRNRRRHRRRPLSDLVAPGHADSIVLVVSSLAKTYAQRLVAAARRVADHEDWPQDKALAPHHLEQARAARIRAGVDPGFWMQSQAPFGAEAVSESVMAAALGKVDRRKLLRQAALQAQEDYDNFLKTGKTVNLPSQSPEKETDENAAKVGEASAEETGNTKEEEDFTMKDVVTPMVAAQSVSVNRESKEAENENEESNKRKNTESEDDQPNKRSKTNPTELTTREEDVMPSVQKEKEIVKVPSSSELPSLDDPLDLKEKPNQAVPAPVPAPAPIPAPIPVPTPAPASVAPAPKSTPKPASTAPMSMEDALLNDLDDDSSDDDD